MKRRRSRGSVVVLGAAIGVFETYRAAQRMGLRTIAVDVRPDAPALGLADEQLIISTRDVDAVHEALLGRDDLRGVVAPASDVALDAQRRLSRRLGLPCGLSAATVRASHDKTYLRQVCDDLGLPTCRWATGVPGPPLLRETERLGLPVVVKPADAQSSRGVARCREGDDLTAAIAEAAAFSYSGRVIVEEEMLGQHLSAECIVEDSRAAFLGLSARTITRAPRAITTEHAMSGELPGHVVDQVHDLVDALCRALDYRRGPMMLDLVLGADDTVRIVEIGARVGGDPLGELVRLTHGVHTVENAVRAAVGLPFDLGRRRRPSAAVGRIILPDAVGTVAGVRGAGPAAMLPGVERVRIGAQQGDRVEGGACLADQLGYVLTTAPTVCEARQRALDAVGALTFDITTDAGDGAGEDMTKELMAG